MDQFRKPNKLDKVEEKLYSPNSDIKIKPRKKMYQEESDLPSDWTDEVNEKVGIETLKKENKKGLTAFTKIFIGAFVFFLLALGYAFFIFNFKSDPNGQNVDITINSPISVAAGEEFSFDVIIENKNIVDMDQIDLAIEYPEGTRSGGDISSELPRERNDIGSISSGSFLRETRNVYLFGEEGETKQIEAKIIYRVADSNAVFEKRKVFDVVLKSTPVRMNVSSVKEITAGQDLKFEIELVSNSNEPIDELLVVAEYPFGFIFKDSTLEPYGSNFVWKIERLEPKEKVQFTVSGEMQGQNNELKYFKFNSGIESTKKEEEIGVLFTTVGAPIEIQRPFLEIDLAVDGKNSSVINLDPDQNYNISINYKNNTNDVVRNVEVVMKLNGDVLDQSSVKTTNGFYNSNDNTITWDRSTFDDFGSLSVGQSGNLDVSFKSKSLTSGETFRSPEISVSLKLQGERVNDNDVPEEIINEIVKTLKFNSTVLFDSNSLYYDGPFENSGSIPPKVSEKTFYTVYLSLSNSSNRISNGVVSMRLPNYVKFENQIWPSGSDVKFNSTDKKIVWDIGEIKEGRGYNGDPVETAFQVSITPSLSQKGYAPVLVDDIEFVGTDLFTGEKITILKNSISTDTADKRNYFDSNVSQ